MSSIHRISGKHLDVEAMLISLNIKADTVWRKGPTIGWEMFSDLRQSTLVGAEKSAAQESVGWISISVIEAYPTGAGLDQTDMEIHSTTKPQEIENVECASPFLHAH